MSRPKDMGLNIVELFAECVGDYARTKKLDSINILFHGGEPLLLGPRYLEQAVQLISSNLPSNCNPIFSLQSNGSLLNREFVKVLCKFNISISISIDGGRIAQNRHRLFANGRSSFDTVDRNIRTFLHSPGENQLFGGILAVVDLRNNPLEVFDFLSSVTTSGLDFLLPDGTHENPPPGITNGDFKYNSKYASWLIPIFDKWFAGGKRKPSMRFFENILALLFGGKSNVEGLGEQYLSLLTIETDGEIRDSDVLSVSHEHAARFCEGAHLGKGCFECLLNSEVFQSQEYLYSPEALNQECQVCDWRTICGGGLVPHRYSSKQKYDNPSIYCGNLKFLFSHIRKKLIDIAQKANSGYEESGAVLSRVNRMDGMLDFKRSWDLSLEVQGTNLNIVEGPEGNISETGDVNNPTSVTLTPYHPHFFNCVEKGVTELVRILVEDINCITYSSCQGHNVPGQDMILPRNVGVLCRDETEQLFLYDLFTAAAANSQPDRPKIFNDWVESGNDLFRTVEIVFECGPRQRDWSTMEESYNSFLSNLKIRPDLKATKTITLNGIDKKQIAQKIKKIYGDHEYSSIHWESQKVIIEDCHPFYRNEVLSVKYQARQGNIAIVNNHAWSLLFWILSAGSMLESNPSLGIHLIHIDFHSDLSSPRIFFCDQSKSFVDYFTHEKIDLVDQKSLIKAIRSTAIGPGSFILPFLYLNRKRKCKLDMIVPLRPAYDGERFNKKRWQIKDDGRALPGAFGNTLRLAPSRGVEPPALEISCKDIFDLEIQTDFDNNLTILDIDFDFFSNRLKGSDNWVENPGWHPDETTRLKLFRQTETILNQLFAERAPNVITLATSPDFCPLNVRREAFGHLNQFLTKSGLHIYRTTGQ